MTAQEAQEAVQCVQAAATRYGLPMVLVEAVRRVEGGRVGEVSRNTNRTIDIGPMQINSIHLPTLERFGISEQELRDNGCLNIHIGAWMLHREILAAPDVWTGIGRYHSKTPELNRAYQKRVWRALERLGAEQGDQ